MGRIRPSPSTSVIIDFLIDRGEWATPPYIATAKGLIKVSAEDDYHQDGSVRRRLFHRYTCALTYISMKTQNQVCHTGLDYYKYNQRYTYLVEEKHKKKMIAITKIMSKIATDIFFVLKQVQDNKAHHALGSSDGLRHL